MIGFLTINEIRHYSQSALLVTVMLYKVTVNTELANTETENTGLGSS